MEDKKHNLKQFNTSNGKYILVNPSSIAVIEQTDAGVIITMKESRDGNNLSYKLDYNLETIYSVLNN